MRLRRSELLAAIESGAAGDPVEGEAAPAEAFDRGAEAAVLAETGALPESAAPTNGNGTLPPDRPQGATIEGAPSIGAAEASPALPSGPEGSVDPEHPATDGEGIVASAAAVPAVQEHGDESRSAEREEARLLVVVPGAATARLIRETLQNFTSARIETTLDPVRGFELALQRPYRLFLFGMAFDELAGPLLYELVSKAYASGRMPSPFAPGVVFVRERRDPQLGPEYSGDVRIKAVLSKPVRIDRLLAAVGGSIEIRDPTQAGVVRKA